MSGPSDAALGKQYGVDGRTIRTWRKEGAPLDDPVAMVDWMAAKRNEPPGKTASAKMHEAKLEKLRLEIERLKRGNDEAAGELIAKTKAVSNMEMVVAAAKSLLNMLPGECPSWAGLKPHEIQARAKEFVKRYCQAMNDKMSSCYAHGK
jgi:hypothetical protein